MAWSRRFYEEDDNDDDSEIVAVKIPQRLAIAPAETDLPRTPSWLQINQRQYEELERSSGLAIEFKQQATRGDDGSSPSDLLDLIAGQIDLSDDEEERTHRDCQFDNEPTVDALVQQRLQQERLRDNTFRSLASNFSKELMQKKQDEIDMLMEQLQAKDDKYAELEQELKIARQPASRVERLPQPPSGELSPPSQKASSDTRHQTGDLPAHFLCPITCDLLASPVIAADGHTYEMSAIVTWLSSHSTSPVTGTVLPSRVVLPNFGMRSQIAEYMQSKGLECPRSNFDDKCLPSWAKLPPSARASSPGGRPARRTRIVHRDDDNRAPQVVPRQLPRRRAPSQRQPALPPPQQQRQQQQQQPQQPRRRRLGLGRLWRGMVR